MDIFNVYAFGTAGYLTLQSLPLVLTPKLITSMLAAEPRRMTDLEAYLSRSLAFALLALAVLCLLLTGAIPLSGSPSSSLSSSSSSSPAQSNAESDPFKSPYIFPTLVVTTTFHAASASYVYAQLTYRGNFAFGAGMAVSAALFSLGVWLMVFGGEKARVSKTTGADKRTGNFPFENKESAREKKKEGRRSRDARSSGWGK